MFIHNAFIVRCIQEHILGFFPHKLVFESFFDSISNPINITLFIANIRKSKVIKTRMHTINLWILKTFINILIQQKIGQEMNIYFSGPMNNFAYYVTILE